MRKYLLPPTNQYKGNMHSHSTCSDGKYTVEELKEAYKAKGYSVFAFSDHDNVIDHSDLNDENFLTITSAELAFTAPNPTGKIFQTVVSCHFNVFSKDPHNFKKIDYRGTPFSFEKVNPILREYAENGYLVSINHPNWSLLTENEFLKYDDCIMGMEVTNCITCNYGGALSYSYDLYMNALRNGKKWIPLGGDDNHSFCKPFEHPLNDSFGSFTYFCAEKLEYGAIIEAMEKGNCYCSQGPQITELYMEDGKAHVKTAQPVKQISVNANTRFARATFTPDGSPVTEACFDIAEDRIDFLVFSVEGTDGTRATTRAYYKGEDF